MPPTQSNYIEYSNCEKYENDTRLHMKYNNILTHSCLGRLFSEFIEQTASIYKQSIFEELHYILLRSLIPNWPC